MRKQPPVKQQPSSKTGPKDPPSVIQLPGGVVVRGYAMRITACDAQGRPSAFEVARGNENSDCVLWASPSFLDERLPDHLDQRWRRRIEESIEGPEFETQTRTYTKERAHGISVLRVGPDVSDALKQRLLVGEKSGAVTVLGRTADGQVELQVNDPSVIEELKKGSRPVSLGSTVSECEHGTAGCAGRGEKHACQVKS